MRILFFVLFPTIFSACIQNEGKPSAPDAVIDKPIQSVYKILRDIPPPSGFKRTDASVHSFESWLRKLPLKKDKTVYLYNETKKPNQSAQFAVVDMSRSKTDLQQCADVVMRLRAEYLFAQGQFDSIRFMDYNKKWYNWDGGENKKQI